MELEGFLFSINIDDGSFRSVTRNPGGFWSDYGQEEVHYEVQIEVIPFPSYPGFMGRSVFEIPLSDAFGNIVTNKGEEKTYYECKYQGKLIS